MHALGSGNVRKEVWLLFRESACQRAMTWTRVLGQAAHLSSLSTLFPLMQLAMITPDAAPSPLSEKSIFSVGLVPVSSSI